MYMHQLCKYLHTRTVGNINVKKIPLFLYLFFKELKKLDNNVSSVRNCSKNMENSRYVSLL